MRYPITAAERAQLVEQQNGRCAICRLERVLVVDHDHSTEEVRGLLCHGCNAGLGFFLEDPSRLAAAAEYVTYHRSWLSLLRGFSLPTPLLGLVRAMAGR